MKKKKNKKKKEKCCECKTRIARFECSCGLKFCGICSENGEWCPADEDIIHEVEKIK